MNERDRIINERANIIDIIKRWHCAQSRDINGHTIWLIDDTERLADKLIEAGFGNCAALTEKWRALLETQCKKTEEAEHRAQVAERALRNITERASCNICDNFSCRYYEGINFDYNAEDCIKWWLAQAEKELAEEKSNGEKKKV